MKQNSKSSFDYDTLVIGGGITGACVLWDSSLRGIKTLLVEKNDFASGTSQATSKLIHGGLRYLKNFEIGLVRESLRERRTLAQISPHAMKTLGFVVPLYSTLESLMLRAGMEMYDKLSWDRNHEINEDVFIPKYSQWNYEQTVHQFPKIPRDKLRGAFLYYDYANVNPERHTTEFIFSALANGAKARNYTQAGKIEILPGKVGYKVELIDQLTQKISNIQVRTIVNASGPWADIIETQLGVTSEKHLVRSKGIHVVVRKLSTEDCVVLKKRDKSHLFVIPWRGKTIIGTTDTVYEEHPDKFRVTKLEIQNLLDEVNHTFGYTKLNLQDVDFYYGGMRPLIEDPTEKSSTYNASRKSEVLDYAEHGFPGFYSALGGKYTTSRAVAELVVDQIAAYLPGNFSICKTSHEPLLGGKYSDQASLCKDLQKKFPKISGEKIEVLAQRYGSYAFVILQEAVNNETYFTLSGGEKFYPEEVLAIAKKEAIQSASDFFFRRSGVGVPGLPEPKSLDGMLSLIAKVKKWSQARLRQERTQILNRYKIQ